MAAPPPTKSLTDQVASEQALSVGEAPHALDAQVVLVALGVDAAIGLSGTVALTDRVVPARVAR